MTTAQSRPRSLSRNGICFTCRIRPRVIKSYCHKCWAAQQRAYKARHRWKGPRAVPDPAMSFHEISRELRIPLTTVYRDFCSGMNKLARNPGGLRLMRALAVERDRSLPSPATRYGIRWAGRV